MTEAAKQPARRFVVAVIGNPNTGKTTLFNALTGLSQHTGNYPGVTVESAVGTLRVDDVEMQAVDLPGCYSLAPRALDEMVALDALMGRGPGGVVPEVVLCVVDASNLERNLYLASQVMDAGRPMVVALTMGDVAAAAGLRIDVGELSRRLGVEVVSVHAARRRGLEEVGRAVLRAAQGGMVARRVVALPKVLAERSSELRALVGGELREAPEFLVERLLIDEGGYLEKELCGRLNNLAEPLAAARRRIRESGTVPALLEAESRYEWIRGVLTGCTSTEEAPSRQWTDRIDDVVTHPVWGTAVFLLTMAMTFQAIFTWAVPLMDAIDGGVALVQGFVGGLLPEGPVRLMLVDGVLGGAGAVVTFVPQIALLFALITILEDSGYMARAAFLMDRIMAGFGLSGRSFIPLLSSFACAVPGILATRAIDDRRDRITTILIAPLMSCSARLPVYVLFIAAFVPDHRVLGVLSLQALTLFLLYTLGMLLAPPVAWLLKKRLFGGGSVPFLLELPRYRVPSWRVVAFRMYDRSLEFVKRAGTVILATAVIVWWLSYYPEDATRSARFDALRSQASSTEEVARIDGAESSERLRDSYLGMAGRWVEPVVRPLGWDWTIGMAVIASFPAREVVIAALGTIYNAGDASDEGQLREVLRRQRREDGSPTFTLPVALSVMVFFALCCQCAATLAAIRRETGSAWYAAFTFTYMTVSAYGAAMLVFQLGWTLLGEG